jgi:hypothetical protein
MPDLSDFQDAFSAALLGDSAPLAPWLSIAPAEAGGLAVYRNTVARGAVDALLATYTTVATMVGENWFRAAAATYAEDHGPREPSLLRYGADFAEWLSRFPPAQDTPYLPQIARLDRLWWESYFAADAPRLDPNALAGLAAADLVESTVRLHPSVRLATLEQSLASLWLAHREPVGALGDFQIEDRPEQMLFVRTGLEVQARVLEAGAFAFLSACRAGESLWASAEQVIEADPTASFQDIVALSLAGGVLSRLEPVDRGKTDER